MPMRRLLLLLAVLVWAGVTPARGADFTFENRSRAGALFGTGAIGFTISPDTFLMAVGGDYFLTNHFSLGPLVQMGVSDSTFLVAPTATAKGVFDLPYGGFARRVKPFVEGGVGFVYANVDTNAGDNDGIDFLFNLGFGCDIHLTDRFALGTDLLFNVVPAEVLGDRFFFSWQFVQAKYRF